MEDCTCDDVTLAAGCGATGCRDAAPLKLFSSDVVGWSFAAPLTLSIVGTPRVVCCFSVMDFSLSENE